MFSEVHIKAAYFISSLRLIHTFVVIREPPIAAYVSAGLPIQLATWLPPSEQLNEKAGEVFTEHSSSSVEASTDIPLVKKQSLLQLELITLY